MKGEKCETIEKWEGNVIHFLDNIFQFNIIRFLETIIMNIICHDFSENSPTQKSTISQRNEWKKDKRNDF